MDNIAKEIAKDIVNSQMQVLEKTVAYMAKKTSEDWTVMARKVMDAYYSDYRFTTMTYDQTFSMRDNVIVPVLKQNRSNWEAGIEFDYSRMSHGDDITASGEFWILNNFLYGYHGNENYTKPNGEKIKRNIFVTQPAAKEILDKYYQTYDTQMDKYFEDGLKLAMLGQI